MVEKEQTRKNRRDESKRKNYFYAHTPGGNLRQININPNWEHHKHQSRERLKDNDETKAIYALRKIDDEPFFGNLKANLKYLRTSVRGTFETQFLYDETRTHQYICGRDKQPRYFFPLKHRYRSDRSSNNIFFLVIRTLTTPGSHFRYPSSKLHKLKILLGGI
ncbi:transposase [Lactobacillus sp. CC-MHH1034]|uniref:transposase n=1 Tax=Agrilactobacillus fermenti TaxID=2586909 RepID=UPI001E3F757E|nr:transposase [Agrilactobacillus fermenti]MCD2257570.1 transposase [Agrilactobacillus fermenti]